MSEQSKKRNSTGIRQRAAAVRENWSPRERAQRTGLPPDMPVRLRAHLNDRPEDCWPPVGVFQLVESRLLPLPIQGCESDLD